MYMHFQMHKGPFYMCIGPLLKMYWGNSGFELGGFDIRGRYNWGKDYVCANVDVCNMGMDPQGSIKDPNAAEKEPQLC